MAFCGWEVDYAACSSCDALNDLTEEERERFERMAGEYLWRWTKQRYGTCVDVIRPCRQDCTAGVSTYGASRGVGSPWTPVLLSGSWVNVGCGGGCGNTCGCTDGPTLRFEKPVTAVTAVQIDGVTLDPSAYRLDNGRLLVRVGGERWPYCQDLSAPDGAPDTWSVTVETGLPVPIGGRLAAGKLACELARAACGDGKCELPRRWQSVTRQGVSVGAAIDLFEGLEEGKTGIWLIDSWVASVTKPDIGFSLAVPGRPSIGRVRRG